MSNSKQINFLIVHLNFTRDFQNLQRSLGSDLATIASPQ